jgi:hypothetical protein
MSETILKEWNSFTRNKPPLGPLLIILRRDPEEEINSEVWMDRFIDERTLKSWLFMMERHHANLWWRIYIAP